VAAAKEAGAPEEWLQEKYTSIRKGSTHGHQAFRILCHAGPGELSRWRAVLCCGANVWLHHQGYQGLLLGVHDPFAQVQVMTVVMSGD
jgi:hypothetical protein